MIDENKEQLRNLFRKYNVVDVQPAVTDKLPDDITTLQVQETRQLTGAKMLVVWMKLFRGISAPKHCFYFYLPSSSLSFLLCCCAWLESVLSQWTGTTAECKNLLCYKKNSLYLLCCQHSRHHNHVYALVRYVFLFCRHQRKLKAIVAGSTGERRRAETLSSCLCGFQPLQVAQHGSL